MQSRRSNKDKQTDEKLDEEFVTLLSKIEEKYIIFNKHIQIRIEKWVEKLLQCDQNTYWRKCRNNYISLLYEMVSRGKISGVFLKMPPEKDLANLSDTEYKRILQQLKIMPKVQKMKNGQVCFAKIECPGGDNASGIGTPNCITDRMHQKGGQENFEDIQEKNGNNEDCISTKRKTVKYKQDQTNAKNIQLIDKIASLVKRHEQKLRQDPQYFNLIEGLQEIITCKQGKKQNPQQQQSAQLRVEEGIGMNMVNLFQFGSPRGKTQMQYFKAALL